MPTNIAVTVLLFVLAFVVLGSAVRIVPEWERGVVLRMGRYVGIRGPGLVLLIPFIERMIRVDLRIVTFDVPAQECITRDNVTVKVNAVVYYRVVNPEDAVLKISNYGLATHLISQTSLRSVLGQSELDELLAHRERLNQRLQQIIDEQTDPWGVKVSVVEIRDVELPQSMQRAMARQAEAERERRAKVIHADGEYQAAERLAEAARIISREPAALQLRYFQTLTEIAAEKSSTILFPLPIDLLAGLLRRDVNSQSGPDRASG
jgi:regulator of protease activity HflC (stomatin/prohibitin superfamily)